MSGELTGKFTRPPPPSPARARSPAVQRSHIQRTPRRKAFGGSSACAGRTVPTTTAPGFVLPHARGRSTAERPRGVCGGRRGELETIPPVPRKARPHGLASTDRSPIVSEIEFRGFDLSPAGHARGPAPRRAACVGILLSNTEDDVDRVSAGHRDVPRRSETTSKAYDDVSWFR